MKCILFCCFIIFSSVNIASYHIVISQSRYEVIKYLVKLKCDSDRNFAINCAIGVMCLTENEQERGDYYLYEQQLFFSSFLQDSLISPHEQDLGSILNNCVTASRNTASML